MEDGQWNDVAFLERLEAMAIRVTLSDDEEQSVEIRIGRAKISRSGRVSAARPNS